MVPYSWKIEYRGQDVVAKILFHESLSPLPLAPSSGIEPATCYLSESYLKKVLLDN